MNQIIGGDPNGNFNYLYYPVIGDGHCFINCFLEATSKTYVNEQNREKKSKIARKVRIDFANFLLSQSDKTAEFISFRLNILNPNVMSKLIGYNNSNKNSIEDLNYIKSKYNPEEINNIYNLIYSYGFINIETKEILTLDNIKFLFERDHRINIAKSENVSPEIYGFGKIPINIGYYELTENIGIGYDELISSINTLIHPTKFLTHLESNLFTSYIGINAIIFPLGTNYKNYYRLIESIKDAPELCMVNLNNIHWNLVSFRSGNNEQLLLKDISENAKNALFYNLTVLYDMRKL